MNQISENDYVEVTFRVKPEKLNTVRLNYNVFEYVNISAAHVPEFEKFLKDNDALEEEDQKE